MTGATVSTKTGARTWRVRGQVQGVGFRPFVYRLATEIGLSGTVRNDPSGVTIEAWGDDRDLDVFARRLPVEIPALARVDGMAEVARGPAPDHREPFRIIESDLAPAPRGRVTIDSATCADCLAEMRDPGDRRFGHGLINCTNCGPRYTIVRDLPYDRPLTTMASFPMCPRCAAEYDDPADRRFHAQPICCPDCGPHVTLLDMDGAAVPGAPIPEAARRLREGGIIAMKGLGGYHLAVDATSEAAVRWLRRAKQRDHKPFAIMVADVVAAALLVDLSVEARHLLASPAGPIVIAPRRDHGRIAPSVAPGSHRLAVLIPNTPMQHLLLAEDVPEALVMTSANVSDDPLICDDNDARVRLEGIADVLLEHDRPIERAVDDSIVIDAPLGILPVRRARGFVPAPLTLPVAAPRPGLCVGGELKNAVAVVRGDQVVLSQHLGDLTYSLAYRRFEQTIDDLLRLLEVEPEWVACDAHPGYVSQQWARKFASDRGVDLVQVQHHHAHLASLLAEHDRNDPIVGLICDGVGYGSDGRAWGGEVLVGDCDGFARAGHLRALRLPGGDAAAKETGRCALSWLTDVLGPRAAHHGVAPAVIADSDRREAILGLLEQDLNCPPSTGLGRLFDAAAAVLGMCDCNHHEAMSGQRLESAASHAVRRPSGTGIMPVIGAAAGDGLVEIDHRPLLEALLRHRASGEDDAALAWLFHDAVADGLARGAIHAAEGHGLGTVGLSGGVFCNTLLVELVESRLRQSGFEVLMHRVVPPNDGGIAFGQAAVAAAAVGK